jgi:hypothetical protein
MSYFIHQSGQTEGPFTLTELRDLWDAGRINRNTLFCEEGYDEWLQMKQLVEVLGENQTSLSMGAPPLLSSSAAPKPSRRSRSVVVLAAVLAAGLFLCLWAWRAPRQPEQTITRAEPMAVSGIESLPAITVRLNNNLLALLRRTDELDSLYRNRCTSREYIAVAAPAVENAAELQAALPERDPRRDLLVNAFDAYQNVALAMQAREEGRAGEFPDALAAAAGVRKVLLRKILEGHMTPEEKNVYHVWRDGLK